MRKQIAAANWKMNLTASQAQELAAALATGVTQVQPGQQVILGVPFPYLVLVQNKVAGNKNIFLSAQNCADKKNGAYTGETSAEMLHSISIPYVIIGHSERREYYHETHSQLATKVDLALAQDIQPIFCCGEPLHVRETNTQNVFVEKQLKESLFHLSDAQMKNFIIAYEPIWAIGTGKTASSDQAQEMHAHIRQVLASNYGNETAESVSILYGGSVKAANATEIFSKSDVDGGLVGGVSLVATEFISIIESLKPGS